LKIQLEKCNAELADMKKKNEQMTKQIQELQEENKRLTAKPTQVSQDKSDPVMTTQTRSDKKKKNCIIQ
jgi:regulator of replication initiation timing